MWDTTEYGIRFVANYLRLCAACRGRGRFVLAGRDVDGGAGMSVRRPLPPEASRLHWTPNDARRIGRSMLRMPQASFGRPALCLARKSARHGGASSSRRDCLPCRCIGCARPPRGEPAAFRRCVLQRRRRPAAVPFTGRCGNLRIPMLLSKRDGRRRHPQGARRAAAFARHPALPVVGPGASCQ